MVEAVPLTVRVGGGAGLEQPDIAKSVAKRQKGHFAVLEPHDHLHANYFGVETHGLVEVADVEHHVVDLLLGFVHARALSASAAPAGSRLDISKHPER